jgi:hypothetical protein
VAAAAPSLSGGNAEAEAEAGADDDDDDEVEEEIAVDVGATGPLGLGSPEDTTGATLFPLASGVLGWPRMRRDSSA